MDITVTLEEIEQLRAQFGNYAGAIAALNTLEDCEGNLEDAAISLAIQVGQEPNTSEHWLDGLAKRWRPILCQPDIKQGLERPLNPDLLLILTEHTTLPLSLVLPMVLYVQKTGVQDFCHLFETKIQ